MKPTSTIIVSNSKNLQQKWNNKTLDEIGNEIEQNDITFEQRYYRNIWGDFWGTIVLSTQDTEYRFLQSKNITHTTHNFDFLKKCVGRYFKYEIITKSGNSLGKFNEGFIICEPTEFPKQILPVGSIWPTPKEIPKNLQASFEKKSLSEAFHENLFSNLREINGNRIHRDPFIHLNYVCIDDFIVYLSNSVSAYTEDQWISELDNLVFYKGISDLNNSSFGQEWFRLGLSNEVVQIRTEININEWVANNSRSYKSVPEYIQRQLNGLTLSESISKGILLNDKTLRFVTIPRSKNNNERLLLLTNHGGIELTDSLISQIDKYIDNLGDLMLKISKDNKGKPVLILTIN